MRGPASETVAFDRFEDVFEAVQAGTVTHGILPIENSVGGSIHRNYDLLLEHELPIVGETELTVLHNLLALPGRRSARFAACSRIPRRWRSASATCARFRASKWSRLTTRPAARD